MRRTLLCLGLAVVCGSAALADEPRLDAPLRLAQREAPKSAGKPKAGTATRDATASDMQRAWDGLKKLGVTVEVGGNGQVYKVDATGKKLTDGDLRLLAPFAGSLEEINLSGTAITDEGLVHLASLGEVQRLYLDETKVTDKGLPLLKPLKKLEGLSLAKTKVTGSGFKDLKELKSLTELNLTESAVVDESMEHLANFPALYTLGLKHTKITGKGLPGINKASLLNVINLEQCDIDDESLLELKDLSNLRILRVSGDKITEDGAKELKDRISSLAVFIDD